MTYAELGREAGCGGLLAPGQGLKKGDRVAIMLPNVMAYPAILFGVLMAGGTVVNVNPLYTPARAHLSAQGFRRALPVRAGEFRRDGRGIAARDSSSIASCSSRPAICSASRARIVNLVSRHVKKAVKPFSLPQADRLQGCHGGGREAQAASRCPFRRTTSRSCNIPAARRASPRAPRCSIATWPPTCSSAKPGCVPFFGDREDHVMVTALPLYHIFALTVCALLMTQHRRMPAADRQSARHSGLRQDAAEEPHHADVRPQHALQCAGQCARHREGGFLADGLRRLRRHGDPGGRGEEMEGGDRAAHRRRLRPVGDLARGLRQPPRHRGVHRHHRLSAAVDGRVRALRRRRGPASRRAGRVLREGTAGHGRLLAAARRDREGHDRGRLFPHRRRGGRSCPTGR